MSELELNPVQELEESMFAAARGEAAAAKQFFELLLRAKLFVPQRAQNASFKNLADYPNDFFNFLALKFEDRVLVPVFFRLEGITDWAEKNLEYREIDSAKLFHLMPEDWWIVINPGAEIHKEISPWEIERLKNGTIEISEIVEELQAEQGFEGFSIETPPVSDFIKLKQALSEKAQATPNIKALYLLKEKGRAEGEEHSERLLAGFELLSEPDSNIKNLRNELQQLADQIQIGAEKVRVIFLSKKEDSTKGIFLGVEPFFSRSQNAFTGLISRFKRLLGL